MILISISGSAIVFRGELGRAAFQRKIRLAGVGTTRLTAEQVERIAERDYPAYEILGVTEPPKADEPDAVVMLRGRNARVERLFNPYTGADLGDPRSWLDHALSWLADLHDNLLSGLTGRTLNGIGALLLTLIASTGVILWWPGIKNWRRGMSINWRARFARVNWDVHSAVGFWCSVFVLIWGISGICLCFPGAFDFLLGVQFRLWVTRLHFGQFNPATETVWTIVGLAPAVLAVTGALMWWNRVLSKKLRRR